MSVRVRENRHWLISRLENCNQLTRTWWKVWWVVLRLTICWGDMRINIITPMTGYFVPFFSMRLIPCRIFNEWKSAHTNESQLIKSQQQRKKVCAQHFFFCSSISSNWLHCNLFRSVFRELTDSTQLILFCMHMIDTLTDMVAFVPRSLPISHGIVYFDFHSCLYLKCVQTFFSSLCHSMCWCMHNTSLISHMSWWMNRRQKNDSVFAPSNRIKSKYKPFLIHINFLS